MKKEIIIILMLIQGFTLSSAQEFTVKSFKFLANDIAAIKHEKTDINGQKCAIIKVLTNVEGAFYDSGFGIEHKEQKGAGEVWLWVSPREKRLKVKKSGFLPLEYDILIAIQASKVYKIEIKGVGADKNLLIEKATQWLIVDSKPTGADFYIDSEYVGVTPVQRKMELGTYSCTIKKSMYHTNNSKIELVKSAKFNKTFELKPSFGFVELTSTPETGASIELDGFPIESAVTPFKSKALKSGEHTITLKKEDFKPTSKSFTIIDGETTSLSIALEPNFSSVIVESLPNAEIYIDNKKVATGKYTGRLSAGVHDFEARIKNYNDHKVQKTVAVGNTLTMELIPQLKTGNADLISEPFGAKVWLKGKQVGETPFTFENIAIGKHEVLLTKEGYGKTYANVLVKENETVTKKVQLNSAKEITFSYTHPERIKLSKNMVPSTVQGKKVLRSETKSNFNTFVNGKPYSTGDHFNSLADLDYSYNALFGYPRISEEASAALTRERFQNFIPEGNQIVYFSHDEDNAMFYVDLHSREQSNFKVLVADELSRDGETVTELDHGNTIKLVLPCHGGEFHSSKERIRYSSMATSTNINIAQSKAYYQALKGLASMINTTIKSIVDNYTGSEDKSTSSENSVNQEDLKGVTIECKQVLKKGNEFTCYYCLSIDKEELNKNLIDRIKK